MKKIFFYTINLIIKILTRIFYEILFGFRSESNKDIEQIMSLYSKNGFNQFFTRIRFWDAPFIRLKKMISEEKIIIDLGCGQGFLLNYLALTNPKQRLIGIDLNNDRLKIANKNFKNTTFILGNVLNEKIPQANVILMVHLLHHLNSYDKQEQLIKDCYKKIKKQGRLIIVEVGEKPLLKYIFSKIADYFLVPILFERKFFTTRIFYRKGKQWKDLIEKCGFNAKISQVNKGFPFSHIIIEATKK